MRIAEYLDASGRSPFARWFDTLEARAAAKITTALSRLAAGNTGAAKSVGHGVHELRIDWGPGYRVYFGMDGEDVVILVAGGTKHRQQADIVHAVERWQDYRMRKRRL